jgi:hypothetical protein
MKMINLDGEIIEQVSYVSPRVRKIKERRIKRRIGSNHIPTICFECKNEILDPFFIYCGECWKKHDKKQWARMLANYHLGRARKKLCEQCGSNYLVEWHHPNYDRPLDVIALCKDCHIEADKFDNV